jgi:hypothetical protein
MCLRSCNLESERRDRQVISRLVIHLVVLDCLAVWLLGCLR